MREGLEAARIEPDHLCADAQERSPLEESWPTVGEEFANPWHRNAPKFVALIDRHQGFWGADFDLKYLDVRIDTRSGDFVLLDRDKNRIHADRVIAAINKYRGRYPDLFDREGRVPSSTTEAGQAPGIAPNPTPSQVPGRS